ncbi:peptidase S49 [Oleiphilus sp. HI0078]|nr:peptidase S49 [Oleiphilus sp. HI0043]KZY41516.1 peptidase S49 [Oleiphilus sp. HI0050]KZY59747.1 peptidase S49 [Oleiphilus sp. HI0061]KZY77733.1 peptidase S49 [Oleiphilus sp. HI0068]KZY86344.1 peptidase S49 [Oleiphilus sp. HI0069]KZY91583.1 peptidase S49 [Oleiphilus sp. HI0072]KZZ19356.1 peptidase S49 [Oleiphilus sp. HI0078]KZZ32259.1 peptidase S49 [Oleiphilus sp. HI0117]KZZ33089.1 peptidase S49 [Oleiphilus sp. HI0085]KZZ38292.1 peptidase S49 [Oleiphilus sp. HI0086]KZZ67026.1 peptidase 
MLDSENNTKEWKLIEKTVSQLGVEQRKARRWGVFFKLLTFAYLFVLLFMMSEGLSPDKISDTEQYTALVNLEGVIASGEEANADFLVTGLRAAFEAEGTQAVVLRINSPGGSPVQSGYVYDEIKRLRGLYPETPLYAVISDIGASGAYYIAAAADKIYADKASLVGSIGVVASGFGFVDTMKKLGVERRLYTAGAHKGFLDPFSDEKGDEVEFWESVLNTTHQQFIAKVKEGRGERLKVDEEIFSGLIWSGEQALEKGLVDGLGSAGYVAREVVGAEEIIDFTPQPDPFERFTKTLGIAAGSAVGKLLTTSPLTIQ